mmetsp:Transcript_9884/g.15845  ORF Transcript_9884/g.15845 Transcript_9884/m.15845 type:complete len:118 (+) Transcript_9884:418-771(+)
MDASDVLIFTVGILDRTVVTSSLRLSSSVMVGVEFEVRKRTLSLCNSGMPTRANNKKYYSITGGLIQTLCPLDTKLSVFANQKFSASQIQVCVLLVVLVQYCAQVGSSVADKQNEGL